jgi:glycerophosphoryl diester phosphodiesterase
MFQIPLFKTKLFQALPVTQTLRLLGTVTILAGALSAAAVGAAAPANAQAARTLDGKPPVVIGHRGASGYLPEHTLEAYKLAIEQGADFIEPDLVMTKDGHLIARHEPMLSSTTNVADKPEFAARKTTKLVDGVETNDWFASDFTIDEIRTLRARQPVAERDQSHNGAYYVPTLQEIIDLAKAESQRRGRVIGVVPEIKHSTFHAAIGLPMEGSLVAVLRQAGWTTKDAPVIIQSFEVANLKFLRRLTNVRLIQLIDADDVGPDGKIQLKAPYERPYDFVVTGDKRTYADLVTPAGLREIKTYADGVGPWKPYIMATRQTLGADGKPRDLNNDGKIDEQDRTFLPASTLVGDAHAAGLFVHTWTFRNEVRRLPSDAKGDPEAEMRAFFALGIDGLFTDFPDSGVRARGRTQ